MGPHLAYVYGGRLPVKWSPPSSIFIPFSLHLGFHYSSWWELLLESVAEVDVNQISIGKL